MPRRCPVRRALEKVGEERRRQVVQAVEVAAALVLIFAAALVAIAFGWRL